MPGGPKLTPSNPEKKKVMEKWVNQGAMIMRLDIMTIKPRQTHLKEYPTKNSFEMEGGQ